MEYKNNKKRINTVLTWDEKYPSSYVFIPSKVFDKWSKQNGIQK